MGYQKIIFLHGRCDYAIRPGKALDDAIATFDVVPDTIFTEMP